MERPAPNYFVLHRAAALRLLCFLTLVASLITPGCRQPQRPTAGQITVEDYFGRRVSLSQPVERIIPTYYAEAEVICALGAKRKIVGIGYLSNDANAPRSFILSTFMPEVYTLPQVGRGTEINIEKLLSLQPQVVICENQQQVVGRIEDLGIKAVALFPQKLGDVFAEIKTIGQLVGHEERADRLGSHLSQLVNRVKDKTDALQPANLTSLYYVRADLLTTVGDEGHNEIFRICGGKNVVTNAASPYSVKVSLENLYGWDPEVIIIRDRSPLSVADVLSDPRLGNLKAVKSKRVYKEHPGWMEYRLETPFGILEKARWLQPALFDGLNPESEFQSFVNLLREFNR